MTLRLVSKDSGIDLVVEADSLQVDWTEAVGMDHCVAEEKHLQYSLLDLVHE